MLILAQILSLIAMILSMVAIQLKTKKQILLTMLASNTLFVISYLLLDSYTGALICGIAAIEISINTLLEEKGKNIPKLLTVIYIFIVIIFGSITFNGIIDLLPIISAILFIFTFIQTKEKYIRWLLLGNLIFWGIYDFFVSAYAAGISDLFSILSAVIAIYRYDIKK